MLRNHSRHDIPSIRGARHVPRVRTVQCVTPCPGSVVRRRKAPPATNKASQQRFIDTSPCRAARCTGARKEDQCSVSTRCGSSGALELRVRSWRTPRSGPCTSPAKVDSEEQALETVNATEYDLSSAVVTRDVD